jgi:ubiquinone/menaquinone biosynthesis C-methylase UbiE
MQHEHNSHNARRRSITGHIVFLVVALLILAGLYLYFQNTASVLLGSLGLVLVHLAIAGGLLYLLRGFLQETFRKLHAPPDAHGHTHDDLQTEGATIRWASIYDLLVKTILFGREDRLREAIVGLARIRPGEKVLDVGCGTGSLAITASLKSGPGAEIHGTDASPQMIERAREKAARAGAQVDFQPGLVEAIDAPENTFDLVMNSFMVHHLPGDLKQKAFAEIQRVIRPGGRLLIVDFEPPKNRLTRALLRTVLGPGMMSIDNSRIPPLLQAAGFVSIKTGNAGHNLATFISAEKPVL